jgi:hypothetical protein
MGLLLVAYIGIIVHLQLLEVRMESELERSLSQELDLELAPELLLLELRALVSELGLELESVLQSLTELARGLE